MGIVAFILGMLITLIGTGKADSHDVTVIPPMPKYLPRFGEMGKYDHDIVTDDDIEWELYHIEAVVEYADEFTALFESYQVKRARNGALMIRQGDSGSFRFAKKG